MQREAIGVKYSPAQYTYGANLADSQTDTVLPTPAGGVGHVMPTRGWVKALCATNDDAQGGGALSFDVKIGSTQQGIDLASAITDTAVYRVFRDEQYPFAAGAVLGATYTSEALDDEGDVQVDIHVVLVWD